MKRRMDWLTPLLSDSNKYKHLCERCLRVENSREFAVVFLGLRCRVL